MKVTAVIMAGGKGERFWPKSRGKLPKQFLSLTEDGLTMIQHTVNRLSSIVDVEDIFIVTSSDYINLVKKQLPVLPDENILTEPMGKNTAPCIGFAASVIDKKYQDAVMIVLPADHLIKNNEIYIETLNRAINIAGENDNLVTIGITPTYPETGYGYINFEKNNLNGNGYAVKKFVEKPDLNTAKEYLKSGQYLWNSGMFLFKVSSIMKNFSMLMPDLYEGLLKIKNSIDEPNFNDILFDCFNTFKSESIDYGIMEKAKNIYTIPGDFGWDDVGSWLALERINKTDDNNNVIMGDVMAVNSNNCIICGDKKLISLVGVNNLVIVDTDDAVLICDKKFTQNIKDLILTLKENDRLEVL